LIRPTYDRVVVQKQEEAEVSKGGIVIPDVARNPTQVGVVVAVGPGRNIDAPGGYRLGLPDDFEWKGLADPEEHAELLNLITSFRVVVERPQAQVKTGDTVLWGKHAGSEVKVAEETFYILREDEILAVLDPEPKEAAAPAA